MKAGATTRIRGVRAPFDMPEAAWASEGPQTTMSEGGADVNGVLRLVRTLSVVDIPRSSVPSLRSCQAGNRWELQAASVP